MTWRSERDETNFSPARKIAWEIVFPYMHLYILEDDEGRAQKATEVLERLFSKKALSNAAKKLETIRRKG